MKTSKTLAVMTAVLLSLTALTACGTKESGTAVSNAPAVNKDAAEKKDIIEGDGIIEGSFGTVEGQSLPEAAIPDKPADCTPITAEDGFKELEHRIFSANAKDAIFKHHSSMSLTLDDQFQHPNDSGDYFYMTADHSYMHASYYEQYSIDREVFQLSGTDTNSPVRVYMAELSEDYDGLMYWYVPESEENFVDFEHEHYTDVFTKDGVLWQYSKMDETGSKNYLDMMMGGSYDGEIVNCLSLSDADNYELIEVRYYAEKDGKTYLMGIHKMQYDQTEPETVSSFLNQFDKGGNDTATVTFVANPGADNEISKSLMVPQYSTVTFFSKDIAKPDVFLDADCTQPTKVNWDGKSDIIYYITPHKE